jgi:two-component system chemotaxis response regulator CheB
VTVSGAITQRIDAVVIGASAGGVEAITQLLLALQARSQVTFFIVLHLPRQGPSRLVDVFTPKCVLPVREGQDKDPVQPGTVYVAPPDYHLLVDQGPQIALSTEEPVHFSRPSIDVLFESAADIYGNRLLGIILTGANQDGAAGLAAVRKAGGSTIVQDPRSAQSPAMTLAALELTTPDFVLPLPEIAGMLAGLNVDAARIGLVQRRG